MPYSHTGMAPARRHEYVEGAIAVLEEPLFRKTVEGFPLADLGHLMGPRAQDGIEMVEYYFVPIPNRQDKLCNSLLDPIVHKVLEERPVPDLGHGFGDIGYDSSQACS